MLGAFKEELDRLGPKFDIHGSQVQILQEPKEFYETLKVGGNMYTKGGYALMGCGIEQDIECREEDISIYIVYRENRT